MAANSEEVILDYAKAYQKLYNRMPKDLHALDNGWVVVNGARMNLPELEYLTQQLKLEYRQSITERRSVVSRLISWLKG